MAGQENVELEHKGGNLENEPVRRVRQLLAGAGYGDRVIELSETARTAQDAADAIGTDLGSIVKSLVFQLGDTMVMALVAGDHQCLPENLPRALALDGNEAMRPDADAVKATTGYSIGGVAPIGSLTRLPMVIDRSLKRSGRRNEGVYYSMNRLVGRLSRVLEALALLLLGLLFGYVSGEDPGPAPDDAFRFLMGIFPFICLLAAWFLARRLPIEDQVVKSA